MTVLRIRSELGVPRKRLMGPGRYVDEGYYRAAGGGDSLLEDVGWTNGGAARRGGWGDRKLVPSQHFKACEGHGDDRLRELGYEVPLVKISKRLILLLFLSATGLKLRPRSRGS